MLPGRGRLSPAPGELSTPTGQSSHPGAPVHTHLHQINVCPLIPAGLLSHCYSVIQPYKRHNGVKSRLGFVPGPGLDRAPGKSSRRTETLPFDSAPSPSRSSRLFPGPTAPRNTAKFSISSACRRRFCSIFQSARPVCSAALPSSLRDEAHRLVPVLRVRAGSFVSRGSRKQRGLEGKD